MNDIGTNTMQHNICEKRSHFKEAASIKECPAILVQPHDIALNMMSVPLSAHCTQLESRQLRHSGVSAPVQTVPHEAFSLSRFPYNVIII
jgi:hypothetical protein